MSRIRRRRCRELETKVIQMTVGSVAYHPATSCTQECNNNALGLTVVTNLEGRAAGRAPSTLSAHQRDAASHDGTDWEKRPNGWTVTAGYRMETSRRSPVGSG